jgi:hypothetical protein
MKPQTRRRVIVKIENLVLKGLAYEDRYTFAQGLQEQLTQVFSQPAVAERLSTSGSIARLHVGQVKTAANVKPQQVGIATAKRIAKGLLR